MFFSIIMPVYNAAAYLRESIKSITNQDFQDFELILIDDGSTDNSFQMMESIAKDSPGIRCIHQENKGPSIARNKGLDLAQGEYILFIDSDDQYLPNSLSKLHDKIIQFSCPDVLCFGYSYARFQNDNIVRVRDCVLSNPFEFNLKNETGSFDFIINAKEMLPSLCNKAFSKKIIEDNDLQLQEGLYIGEDLAFNLALLEKVNHYVIVSEVFYLFIQQNTSSLINRYDPHKFDQLLYVHRFRCTILDNRNARFPFHNLELNKKMDFIRLCFSCFMDLFHPACTLKYNQKVMFIKNKRGTIDYNLSVKEGLRLPFKSKIIYLIFYKGGNRTVFCVSWICYQLKFKLGVSF